jgi:hypothetical protein
VEQGSEVLQVIARGPSGTCLPVEVAKVEMMAEEEEEENSGGPGALVYLTVSGDEIPETLSERFSLCCACSCDAFPAWLAGKWS